MLFLVLLAVNAPSWMFISPIYIPLVLSIFSAVCYAFVFNFFRCPKRTFRGNRENAIVSSVDGKVVAIEEVYEPEWLKCNCIQFSVFMSPLNVHANWFPVDGKVVYVRHHRGRFYGAYLPKSSTENERSSVGIVCKNRQRILVRQVAGAMARRIVTYAQEGEEASIDQHLGFIKFGSRVDIYLPLGTEICTKLEAITSGGITLIGRMK